MDFWSVFIAVVAGLGIGWLLVRNKNVDFSKMHVINVEDFKNNMRKGQLVDIRKNVVYEQEHIKGARNFKPSTLTTKYSKLRKDQSVYLYCQNGRKSKRVARKMIRKDFGDIFILDGGYDNYKK
jgi:rhodanese-related sulfurtransferase